MLGAKRLIIKGDNLSVIQAIKRIWKIPWDIDSLIMDAGQDLNCFEDVCINHGVREGNSATDWMAHRGHSCSNLSYWFDSPAHAFSLIIRKDALGWPLLWDPLYFFISFVKIIIIRKGHPSINSFINQAITMRINNGDQVRGIIHPLVL